MPGGLDGKVAIITDGTSGIGEATACFAAEGARLVMAGRSERRGNAFTSGT
jgi:NADP-dependent 3-hydroxy acid dehydrogenase YdfG